MTDVNNEVLSLKKKLLGLRVKLSGGELKDTSVVKKTKKQIARLLTDKSNKKQGGTNAE